jgi:hypothetical protein
MANRERRLSVRRPCDDDSVTVVMLLCLEPCKARLWNLSADGIAVLVEAIVAPGDNLIVELHNSAMGFWCCKKLQVVHAQHAQSGRWLVGGAFSEPLSAEALRMLLPPRPEI